VARFQTSLHLTLAGMINQTRYLFGAQVSATPPAFGAGGALETLPQAPSDPASPAGLVDDLLRRKCLRCHVSAVGSKTKPPYRARGCAACHVVYGPDGRYQGRDKAMDRTRRGLPEAHGLTADIPDSQCLKCHRPNYVGSDAHGLFERDYDSFFQQAVLGKNQAHARAQGPYHVLSQDLHVQQGMRCLDCHSQDDVMGDGRLAGLALDSPGTTCQDCHGGFGTPEPDSAVPGLEDQDGEWFFSSRSGEVRPVPLFRPHTPSHDPNTHSRLRCSACHAAWTAHDYGLSLQRQDGGDFRVWTYLVRQGDAGLEQELSKLIKDPVRRPQAPDLLTGEMQPGLWLKGFRFRRWENLVLGVDHRGRVSLMRPLHQYQVSYVDSRGRVLLDSVVPRRLPDREPGWAFMPFVPHTTGKKGRPCESCHGSAMAAGLGLGWTRDLEAGPDFDLLRPSPPAVSGMRLLNPREQQRLLNPGSGYEKNFFQDKKGLLKPLSQDSNQGPGPETLSLDKAPQAGRNQVQPVSDDS
jgi:hypothetical protein